MGKWDRVVPLCIVIACRPSNPVIPEKGAQVTLHPSFYLFNNHSTVHPNGLIISTAYQPPHLLHTRRVPLLAKPYISHAIIALHRIILFCLRNCTLVSALSRQTISCLNKLDWTSACWKNRWEGRGIRREASYLSTAESVNFCIFAALKMKERASMLADGFLGGVPTCQQSAEIHFNRPRLKNFLLRFC